MYWLQQLVERARVQCVRREPGLHKRCRLDGALERLKRPAPHIMQQEKPLSPMRDVVFHAFSILLAELV